MPVDQITTVMGLSGHRRAITLSLGLASVRMAEPPLRI